MSHEIYFDSTCPLCQKAMRSIQAQDTKKQFIFYPLNSAKAKASLPEALLNADTLVLLENGRQLWVRAQAVFRILKLLDGKWRSLGFLAHVSFLNLFYRIIAHNRHLFG